MHFEKLEKLYASNAISKFQQTIFLVFPFPVPLSPVYARLGHKPHKLFILTNAESMVATIPLEMT